jgi:protein-tyrosine-phosphatase/DNA-binding transcriptional ArsR family regulator
MVGHPLRWRLLRELARSDRQVRELVELIGEAQSLVSYHLRQLCAVRLVAARRSSADRRHAYYSADLVRCGELLGGVGAALHPGLRLAPVGVDAALHPGLRLAPVGAVEATAPPGRVRVLFLCTANSARSQMAEGFLQHLAGDAVDVRSAGSHPTTLHPNAVAAMAEYGIDLSGRQTKHLDVFAAEPFDYVVTLCDRVREVCPEFRGHREPIHWSIANPNDEGPADQGTYPAFQRVAEELAIRVRFLFQLIVETATHRGKGL